MDSNNKMFYLPAKYRAKLYTFQAGGYDGCICHPAMLIVTGVGDVILIGSDGGAGGLDYDDWYTNRCRNYLRDKNVSSMAALLTLDNGTEEYTAYQKFMRDTKDEQRNMERERVFKALEYELGGGECHGWDHEFCEYDISSIDAVRNTCKSICRCYTGVNKHAAVAQALRDAGYDGAGFVCTDCGAYVEHTEMEEFQHCIDADAYHGIGGIATEHTRILCDDCRDAVTCPQCQNPNLPNFKVEQGHEYDHYTFEEVFIAQWCDVCEYCADRFTSKNEYKHWSDDISDLEDKIDEDKAQLKKYLEAMKEGGSDEEQLKRLEADNLARMKTVWRGLVNDLRDRMEEDVADFFTNCSERAKDRLTEKDTNYVY